MKRIFFVAIVAVAVSCSSSKHAQPGRGNNTEQTPANSAADGSSYERAIVIQEKSETVGVQAEYKWLRAHYPGYSSKGQSLQNNNKKPYDVITIVTADGSEKKVYFDISNFFGKF